jgi:hypothetical protein
MTVAVIVDDVDLEYVAGDIVHQLVAAGEGIVLVPTTTLRERAPGWDGGFPEMLRDPSAAAHLDGSEYSFTIEWLVVFASANWLATAVGDEETTDDAVTVFRSAFERGRPTLVIPGWAPEDEAAFETAQTIMERIPSAEWLDPGTGARSHVPTVSRAADTFDPQWIERWYWA